MKEEKILFKKTTTNNQKNPTHTKKPPTKHNTTKKSPNQNPTELYGEKESKPLYCQNAINIHFPVCFQTFLHLLDSVSPSEFD